MVPFLVIKLFRKNLSLCRDHWYLTTILLRRPYSCNNNNNYCTVAFHWQKCREAGRQQADYAAIGGMVVSCLAAIWRKNIVSILSQMVGAFILISIGASLFDPKRKITSSIVNEFSLIILRRSNLGVCNSSIFLGRVSSMRLGLGHALKSLLLCSSRCSL
jgi:hypothetical protein